MFRDDSQRAEVCNAFLLHFGKPPLFTAEGPKPEVLEYVREGYPGSSKEADFFRLAWALWDGDADIGLLKLLAGLDRRSCRLLASFVEAEDLDAWLQEVSRDRPEWARHG